MPARLDITRGIADDPTRAENEWEGRTVWLGPVRAKVFKPIASPRVSYKKLDDALKEAYGQSANTSIGAMTSPAN